MAIPIDIGPGVVLYTTDYCAYCVRAKILLQQRGVPFREIKISYDDDEIWEALIEASRMRTVPQIYADGKVIGGYLELAALDRQDELSSLKKE